MKPEHFGGKFGLLKTKFDDVADPLPEKLSSAPRSTSSILSTAYVRCIVSYRIVFPYRYKIASVVAHQKLEIGIRDRRAVSQIEKIEMRNQRDSIQ